MDLSEILAISGKSGLYKVVSQTKNGLIVESLIDGKKHLYLPATGQVLLRILVFLPRKRTYC